VILRQLGLCGLLLLSSASTLGQQNSKSGSQVLCEQSVSFDITPPGSDVPVEARVFSGIWTGYWLQFSRCMAIVVENIGRDGSVDLIFANGPWRGYAGLPASPTSYGRHKGTVKNGVLEIRFPSGNVSKLRSEKPGELYIVGSFPLNALHRHDSAVLRQQPY
jgi:hypothetical protein